MNRLAKSAVSIAAAAGIAAGGIVTAGTADAAPKLNGTDAKFLRANEQTNLAEITLGKIVLQRGTGTAARNLARSTVADHRTARTKNMAVARATGISLPTAPNAMQQKVAKALKTYPRINRNYFIAQVAGHKQSVAQTKYEIRNGQRPRVVAYAKYYLPVAQMHLVMAQRDLARWIKQH